jgi:hypothetical protein
MLKSGDAKVPLRRVPALAAALDVPAVDLMFMCLKAQEPELTEILATILPELPSSEDEVMLMRGYRILREKGIVDDNGVELRGLGAKGRASGWSRSPANESMGLTSVMSKTCQNARRVSRARRAPGSTYQA